MGCVENITYERFPKQKKDLGSVVMALLEGEQVKAVVVRSDDETPNRNIYKTKHGAYLENNEIEGIAYPKQSSDKGKRAKVIFHYDTSNSLKGTVVRDDDEKPYTTLILIDDGRIINTKECQWSPPYGEDEEHIKNNYKNNHVEELGYRLRKLKVQERARVLHGIYKQIMPNRNGKSTKGQYHNLVSNIQNNFILDEPKDFVSQFMKTIDSKELIRYVKNEMEKIPHLKNHANRLKKHNFSEPFYLHKKEDLGYSKN